MTENSLNTDITVKEIQELVGDDTGQVTIFDPPQEIKYPGLKSGMVRFGHEKHVGSYKHAEKTTIRWFCKFMKHDWVVFDVGANIGMYTMLFAQKAPNGRVYAFEPTKTMEMLKRNIAYNGYLDNVTFVQKAVGMKKGELKEKVFRIWGYDPEEKVYPFTTLDDFVEENNIQRLDAIKIDVDSFDFEVLMGAEKTLKRFNPYVVVELNHALAERKQRPADALQWMAKQGYINCWVFDHDNFMFKVLPDDEKAPPEIRYSESIIVSWPNNF